MGRNFSTRGLQRVPLGRTDLQLTRLGMGTVPLGGKYQTMSTGQAVETIRAALHVGINWFDTAPRYGFGLAERRLGMALAGVPRDSYVLATKVGWRIAPDGTKAPDFSREGVEYSIAESLERLSTGRIDIVHIPDPDEHYRAAVDEVFPVLAALRAQGIIHAISVGMNQWQMLTDFARDTDVDCFLLAGRYTLLEQGALETFFPLCQQKQIGLVLGGVYNSGILASGARPGALYNYAPAPPDMVQRVRRIEAICGRHGVPLYVAALQFPLAHPAVTSIVVGAGAAAEVQANVIALDRAIPTDLWAELRAEGLLHGAAPTP
jgi:D-threo-aldose 1-dehydrogenase